MKLFLDSANLEEIQEAASTGLLDGVTTNPSLVAKSGESFEDLLYRICEVVPGPVSAEVTTTDEKSMLEQGRKLAQIHDNITVKLPMTWDGLRATQRLSREQIKTNVTLCFSATQALLAAKSGATFVSPFIGRLDDIGQEGMQLIEDIRNLYDQHGYSTEVLVASIRTKEHFHRAALHGGDIATLPNKVFSQLLRHPLTDEGLAKFLQDWEAAQKK